MLSLQHRLNIGCCAIEAVCAGLILIVAGKSSACECVEWYGCALELQRLRIAETVSRIDLAQGLSPGSTEALALVRSVRQGTSGRLNAL